jgi:negative regulator of replication initiation
MKMYPIEVDENIWHYLQKHAEPFIDSPNSVLRRLLLGPVARPVEKKGGPAIPPITVEGTPRSLSQILAVIYEIEINGYSRTEATHRVAKNRGTAPQTVTDKYCRQLGQKAHEIDQLLTEPGYRQFKKLLKRKFSRHEQVIDAYFESLKLGSG